MRTLPSSSILRPYDRDRLREQFRTARPFPFFQVDDFLDPAVAREVAATMPSFEAAQAMGRTFRTVNERRKLQVTDPAHFPPTLQEVHRVLSSPEFLADLSYITGIPDLLADEKLEGGGMHQTGPGGHLDVHVDFNILEGRGWHRRLNILVYFNPDWQDDWGGRIELWDEKISRCHHSFAPLLNRCVVFETSEISYHGVTPLSAPPEVVRKSYAAYYYTKEHPAKWDGRVHNTIFHARPHERWKGWVAMPLEAFSRRVRAGWQGAKQAVKRMLGR